MSFSPIPRSQKTLPGPSSPSCRRHHRSPAQRQRQTHPAQRHRLSRERTSLWQACEASRLGAGILVYGKEVTLEACGKDKYGRTIADVVLQDGTNAHHELVKDGWRWWYRKYALSDTMLEKLEAEARAARRGLWVDPAPLPPWVYRKARRGQSLDVSNMVPLESGTESGASPRAPPLFGAVESDSVSPNASSSPYIIIGNRRSHIYH